MRTLLKYAVLALLMGAYGANAQENKSAASLDELLDSATTQMAMVALELHTCKVEIPQTFVSGHFEYTDQFDFFDKATVRNIFINRLIAGLNGPEIECSRENSRKALGAYQIEMLKLRKGLAAYVAEQVQKEVQRDGEQAGEEGDDDAGADGDTAN